VDAFGIVIVQPIRRARVKPGFFFIACILLQKFLSEVSLFDRPIPHPGSGSSDFGGCGFLLCHARRDLLIGGPLDRIFETLRPLVGEVGVDDEQRVDRSRDPETKRQDEIEQKLDGLAA